MSLKNSLNFWKDYFSGKYPIITKWDIYRLYIIATPMWHKYSIECDEFVQKIIDNYNSIEKIVFEKANNEFYIFYPDGRNIKIPMLKSLSFFLEDIDCYEGKKMVYSWHGFRPSRITMMKFLNKFSEFVIIKDGKIRVIDPESKAKINNFFNFEGKDNG